MSGFEIAEMLVKGARLLRYLGAENVVGKVRRRASREFFHLLHIDVIHRLRNLAMCMEDGHPDKKLASVMAIDFCSACALLMQQIVESERNDLHCCLKVIVKGKDGADMLQTWARSEPSDERDDDEFGASLTQNTIWNAFRGHSDGSNVWRKMCCFCCNDLTQFAQEYNNGRKEWLKFYKSKLVFPVRYLDKIKPNTWETIGFLEFDSTRTKTFPGMPCVFGYSKDPVGYRSKLEKSAVFHSGAIIADSLSMCLRPYYESRKKQVDQQKGQI